MRSLVIVSLLAGSAVAGNAPIIEGNAPIIQGTADAGDPAVVQIYAYPANKSTLYTCTGTVVSPTAIVTAGHCLDHDSTYVYGVYFEADANAYNGQIAQIEAHLKAVSAVHIHPMYSTASPFPADIGVLVLAAPTTVTPLAFSRVEPDDTLVNAPVKIVGYGEVVSGTTKNARFAATTIVAGIDAGSDTILVGDSTHHTCVGDSGGPVLQNNVILGVDSYGAAGCTDPAHFRRTATYADFIDQYAGTSAGSGAGSGSAGSGSGSGDGGSTDGGGCSTTTTAHGLGAGFAVIAFAMLRRRRR
ncbi:hypothetical protein BH11MYX1_BH11MYX1_50280 [soil metagenome]